MHFQASASLADALLPQFVRKKILNAVMRPFADPASSVKEDVWLLRHAPLMPANIPIHGLVGWAAGLWWAAETTREGGAGMQLGVTAVQLASQMDGRTQERPTQQTYHVACCCCVCMCRCTMW